MFSPVERIGEAGWVPPWVRRQHAERYRFASALAAGKRVLDAACGTGYGAARLARSGAAHVYGADISPEAVALCRAAHPSAGVEFLVGDASRLPLPDGCCDLYVSFETVEHVPDDRAYAAEARRVLAPGGVFLCSTPNRAVTNPGTPITAKPYNPFHLREYSGDELRALLSARFDSVELLGQMPFPGRYSRTMNSLGRARPRTAVRLHQALKLFGNPFVPVGWYAPRAVPPGVEPEGWLAVCRVPASES